MRAEEEIAVAKQEQVAWMQDKAGIIESLSQARVHSFIKK